MAKTKVINLNEATHKWLKLLLHLQNAPEAVHRLQCKDQPTARQIRHNLKSAMDNNPTWFNLVIVQRKETIFIIKTQQIQDVVLQGVVF